MALVVLGTKLGKLWRWAKELKGGIPGARFQDHYKRRHDGRARKGRKTVFITTGVGLLAVGLLFSFMPVGPGSLVILLGAGVLSTESRTAAKALDWLELKVRQLVRRFRSRA